MPWIPGALELRTQGTSSPWPGDEKRKAVGCGPVKTSAPAGGLQGLSLSDFHDDVSWASESSFSIINFAY